MRKLSVLFVCLTFLAFMSCKDTKKNSNEEVDQITETEDEGGQNEMESSVKTVTVNIDSKSDSEVTGEIVFTEEDGRVKMEGKLSGLVPSQGHAIHLHENGDCSSDDGSSAGGHWNPTNEEHGAWNAEEGYHKGDIGNLDVDEDGNASISFETDQWCIGCDDEAKNIIGKSVIVHEDADDFKTQPTGDAGGRIGCGVIEE